MTPVSQIIWKNHQHFDKEKSLLLVCPEADGLATRLSDEGLKVSAICHSHASHVHLSNAGIDSEFDIAPQGDSDNHQIVLFQPREKPLLNMMLALCGASLAQDGQFWLAGANRAGIKSAGKRLEDHFSDYRKTDSARHCGLFNAGNPLKAFTQGHEAFKEEWVFSASGQDWRISSLPGVFAHGRLDEGSRLLLDTLAQGELAGVPGGNILDFACGAGTIGIPLAGLFPEAKVTLLDNSALAIASAKASLATNGVQARLIASDGLNALNKENSSSFEWIVSNPPFHSGVNTDRDVVERFFRDCTNVLKPGGRLCLVANVHLPYGRLLQELFGSVQVIASDRGYNIWLAH